MSLKETYTQILTLDQVKFNEAKNDDSGYYTPESLNSFDEFVNFEITVLKDQERKLQTITPIPLNGSIAIVITYITDLD